MRATRVTVSAVALALAAACGKDTITVHGRVVNHLGLPVSGGGAPVVIDPGEHWPVYPDEDGRFTVTDVETPYDVEVFTFGVPGVGLGYSLVVYQGLTRSDPTLTVRIPVGECLDSSCSARIEGALSGGTGFPQPEDHVTRVAFGAQDLLADVETGQDGTFGWDEAWYGRATVPGELHALQWQADAEGFPSLYTGYGAGPDVILADGASLADQDIALDPVGTGDVSGSATLPAGHSLDLRTVGLRVGEHGYVPIVLESAPETDFAQPADAVTGPAVYDLDFGAAISAPRELWTAPAPPP
jgi:hypothetical protein